MGPVSNRIRYALFGAIIVPCFGRLALHGTGHEHEYYRLVVPLFVGCMAGFLVGLMKDKWLFINADLKRSNKKLEIRIDAQKRAQDALRESEKRYRTLFTNNHSAMLLVDPETANIVDANPAAVSYYGWDLEELAAKKITDINMLTEDNVLKAMKKAEQGPRSRAIYKHRLANGELRDVEVFSGPLVLGGNKRIYSIIHDITDRIQAEQEREKLIDELQGALKEIKILRGIIPICSNCKKIRNDEGAWNQLEEYISEKSNAEFSHGLCPDCVKLLYPYLG